MNQSRDWYIPKNSVEIKANDCAAVGYVAPFTQSNGVDRFQAVAFSGKRNKPDFNYIYKTEAAAREAIANHAQSRKASEAFKAEQHAARNNVRAADHYSVGDLLATSWGYDQTNVEFFKVVRVLDKSVEVVAIAGQQVPGTDGFMSCAVTPNPDVELTKDYDMKDNGIKRVQGGCNGEAYVRIHRHSSGYKTHVGKQHYCSWYA